MSHERSLLLDDPVHAGMLPASRILRDGGIMPALGLGTFGSDRYRPDQVAGAVRLGIELGYRLIDCAAVYGNEAEIGQVVADARLRIPRDEFFIMSKVWNDAHEPTAAIASVEQSIRDLNADYLDAIFVHWPFANAHAPHADTDARDPDATPYDHERFMALWRALEGLADRGVVRRLGTSNVTIPKLRLILQDARVAPALNEMELHPAFQQGELFQFCVDHDIQPVGYSPIGSPSRPVRDRTSDDIVDIEHPVVQEIAAAHGTHPTAVCLKWAVARGQVPIPFAVKPEQLAANLRAVTEDPLTAEEFERMRSVERNSRLIKGQVFLWPAATSWMDLWDVDGAIAGQEAEAR